MAARRCRVRTGWRPSRRSGCRRCRARGLPCTGRRRSGSRPRMRASPRAPSRRCSWCWRSSRGRRGRRGFCPRRAGHAVRGRSAQRLVAEGPAAGQVHDHRGCAGDARAQQQRRGQGQRAALAPLRLTGPRWDPPAPASPRLRPACGTRPLTRSMGPSVRMWSAPSRPRYTEDRRSVQSTGRTCACRHRGGGSRRLGGRIRSCETAQPPPAEHEAGGGRLLTCAWVGVARRQGARRARSGAFLRDLPSLSAAGLPPKGHVRCPDSRVSRSTARMSNTLCRP